MGECGYVHLHPVYPLYLSLFFVSWRNSISELYYLGKREDEAAQQRSAVVLPVLDFDWPM